MSKLVTIYGGSGFVGRQIANKMAKEGWRVRVAVRRPNEAMFVRTYGEVGQVEPVFCNVRDDESVSSAMQGADSVVNCVGILTRHRNNTFDAIQSEGAARIARIAAKHGVETMVHLSAIGADGESPSQYARTKAEGEAGVLAEIPDAMILRPSVVFGPGDGFFNRFASMSRFGPLLVLVGAKTRFQPVFVDDVAQAAVLGVTGRAHGVFELGGPEVKTMREWMNDMLSTVHRTRLVVNMPFFMAGMMAGVLDLMSALTAGIVPNAVLTRDQLRLLRKDNIVSEGSQSFEDLGIEPTAPEVVMPEYLWRFRPSGQYDAIKESAKDLKL